MTDSNTVSHERKNSKLHSYANLNYLKMMRRRSCYTIFIFRCVYVLRVFFSAPIGRIVPCNVEGNSQAGFQVDYDSREVGQYMLPMVVTHGWLLFPRYVYHFKKIN